MNRQLLTLSISFFAAFSLITNTGSAFNSFSSKGFSLLDKPLPSFGYDLQLSTISGTSSRVMICFHGFGGDHHLAQYLKLHAGLKETLVTFNFPDHGITGEYNPDDTTFGTINELLPALYVLKRCILEQGVSEVTLYGFSAGAAALINMIKVLSTSNYDKELKTIGISLKEKRQLLDAVQESIIILDTPLKSVDEIIDVKGPDFRLEAIGKCYRDNNFVPIDSLQYFSNLSLNVILHFQRHDEILSNRDDKLFIQRLKKYNAKGKTHIVIGNDGGHNVPHTSLWKYYSKMMENSKHIK